VQTKWAVPEGAKYPEPVWQVWIRQYTYTTPSGFVMRWVIVPKETIIHERPPGLMTTRCRGTWPGGTKPLVHRRPSARSRNR
jgi:hypothetical protein